MRKTFANLLNSIDEEDIVSIYRNGRRDGEHLKTRALNVLYMNDILSCIRISYRKINIHMELSGTRVKVKSMFQDALRYNITSDKKKEADLFESVSIKAEKLSAKVSFNDQFIKAIQYDEITYHYVNTCDAFIGSFEDYILVFRENSFSIKGGPQIW